MKANHRRRSKLKKETANNFYHVVTVESKIPKAILLKLRDIKKRKGKIPVLVIRDREQKAAVEIKLCTKTEDKIRAQPLSFFTSLGLDHFLNCREGRFRWY